MLERRSSHKQTEMTMTLLRNLSIALAFALPAATFADGDAELAEKMGDLQYFAHKTALAVDHKNKELAGFYAHELEEFIEDAATIESYDGHEVGKLINSMLVPAFESFEKELKAGDWKKASKRFDEMLSTCNACHDKTEHGFITIERTSENPFMQSFKAKK